MGILIAVVSFASLAALTVYLLALAVGRFRETLQAGRTQELERQLLAAQIERIMDARRFEKERVELSWNGFRKFEIVRKVVEGAGVCSFYLAPHDRLPLPPFLPGQYLTFQLNIPDPIQYPGGRRRAGRPVIRCYSLSDSPNHPDYYRVTIKKIPPPPQKPDAPSGLASSFFHDILKEGEIVDVRAPTGHFVLDVSTQSPIVMIAGGIGITPLLCMLNALTEAGSKREAWFFYGIQNPAIQIMRDHLNRLARENPNVHLHTCYSDAPDGKYQLRPGDLAEPVSVALIKRLLPSSNYEFYICGPPPMMNQIIKELKEWGVPDPSIFMEAFGPATVKGLVAQAPAAVAATETGFEITFAKSGKVCTWKADSGCLLDFACANGVSIDSGCRAGNCGTCVTAVKSGEVKYLIEQGAKPESGSCLTCISVPKTNLVLDA